MIKVIRWLKGYVRVKVWGFSPERFMNLCTNRGIILWKVTGYDGCYEMNMSVSDFFSIRDIARKTKIRAAVLEKKGLPFFMRDVRRRKVFTAGLLGSLAVLLLMSRFLWAIEFVGNEQLTDEMLMNFLRTQAVVYGMKQKDLDLEQLEDLLREKFPQITWASMKLEGTKLTVWVKENDLPQKASQLEEAQNWEYGADLVAAKDGTVVEILTRKGVPAVKKGDMVKKGDILVSGQVPVRNDDQTVREWQTCISDADIWIAYEQEVNLDQLFSYEYKNYTGKQQSLRFFTMGKKRYLLGNGNCHFVKYDEVVQQQRIQLFSQIDLPVAVGEISYREYLPVEALYDENSAQALLEKRFLKIVDGLEQKGVHIIQKDVKIIRKTDRLTLAGTLTVRQEAAILSPADPAE